MDADAEADAEASWRAAKRGRGGTSMSNKDITVQAGEWQVGWGWAARIVAAALGLETCVERCLQVGLQGGLQAGLQVNYQAPDAAL